MQEPRVKQLARRVLFALSAFAADPAAATTWVVDPAGPLASIQQALDGAAPGDLVRVRPGTYHERLTLRDGVAIEAETLGSVTVEAEGEGSVVTAIGIGTSTTIAGIWFRNGSAVEGGGLWALASSPTFYDCGFEANSAVLGGGAFLRDASRVGFVRCVIAGNVATVGGGLYLDFSQAQVSNSFIHSNDALDGAAIAANNAAEANVVLTTVYANVARQGATIAVNDASPRFTNCTVVSNVGGRETFGMRGSGARIENCIVAFNAKPAFGCSGTSALWVGCNIIWQNGTDTICNGDQGTNLNVDPLFCDRAHLFFAVAANSPAAGGGSCGVIGAVGCAAQGVETAVTQRSFGQIKLLYAH